MALITKYEHQTVFDLLLIHAGAISGMFEFLEANQLTSIEIADGTYFAPEVLRPEVVAFFKSKNTEAPIVSGQGGVAHGAPAIVTLNGQPFNVYAGGTENDIELLDQDGNQIIPDNVAGNVVTVTTSSIPMLPSGTYTPTNSGAGDFELLWENVNTSVFESGDGYISKIANVDSYETRAFCRVNHSGDFILNFKMIRSSNPIIFGISAYLPVNEIIDASVNMDVYKNDLSLYKGSVIYVWERGGGKYIPASTDNDTIYTIERVGNEIRYSADGALHHTSINIPESVFIICGSIYSNGNSITDIEIIIP